MTIISQIRDSMSESFTALVRTPACSVCLRVLYAALRMVIPSNPRQIGFVSCPDFTDSALALFQHLIKDPDASKYRLVWLVQRGATRDPSVSRDIPANVVVVVVAKNSLRGLWSFLRCRYVFATHGVYGFARSGYHQTICNLWHGMPIKAIGAHDGKSKDQVMYMDYSVATSEYFADLIARAFYLPRERVLVTGLPRNEWLLKREKGYEKYRKGRGKLVAWLPTYRASYIGEIRNDSSSLADDFSHDDLARLDRMLDGADAMLVLKFHYMDSRNLMQWESLNNITIFTDAAFRAEGLNLYKLLACSEALVTDFSSCAIDYMLLDRPIGLYTPNAASYTRGFMPEIYRHVTSACCAIHSLEGLVAFIDALPSSRSVGSAAQEVLYQKDLKSPSESILRALGITG